MVEKGEVLKMIEEVEEKKIQFVPIVGNML